VEKLDLKDKKILYQLDINCRQSYRSVGRKVGLSKDIVASRIKKLEKKGIIKNYFTSIDSSKLGYISFRFYIIYQNTTEEIEKQIINYFIKNKYTWVVESLKGKYDLVVCLWVKDIKDFYNFWEKTLKKYHHYFNKQYFSIYFQLYTFKIFHILLLDHGLKPDKIRYEVAGGGDPVDVDKIDLNLLRILGRNARIPTSDIAEKLNLTAMTVKNRIDKLMKSGVIQGFRFLFDYSKLGYQFYKADINLIDYQKKKDIINYVLKNPNLLLLTKSAGHTDLELDFIVKNVDHFHDIMKDLNQKFPNAIKNYDYFYESDIHKVEYIPQELIK
jgi:Lrp/AsnC family leucine-responsive transcriptional regulator